MLGTRYDALDLERILDSCPGLAWIKDRNNQLAYVNKAYRDTFNKSWDEIIGKQEEQICGGAISRGYIEIEGNIHYFEVNERPIYEEGQVVGHMGVAHDMTLEHKLQHQVDMFLVEQLATIQPHIEKNDLVDLANALEVWEYYLFSSAPSIGKAIFLYSEQAQVVEIGVKQGKCKVWKENEEEQVARAYVKEQLQMKQLEGKVIKVKDLPESAYKEVLTKTGIKYVLDSVLLFGDEIVGVISMHFNSKEEIVADVNVGYLTELSRTLAILIKNMLISKQVTTQMKKGQSARLEIQSFFELTTDYIAIVDEKSMSIQRLSKKWLHQGDENLSLEEAYKRAKQEGGKSTVTREYKDEAHQVKVVVWHVRYIKQEAYFLVWGQDITNRRLFEKKKEAVERQIAKEKITRELLAYMSYEFEDPITKIEQLTEQLEQVDLKTENAYVGMIKGNTYRLKRLINNLLASSEERYEGNVLKRELCDLVQVIRTVVESMASYVQDSGKSIEVVTDEGVILCAVDVEKIEHIMMNLISNAFKYTDVKGHIVISVNCSLEWIEIHVIDDGEGIKADRLDRIFERFNDEDIVFTKKKEGSGIGLSTVKYLTELHGGCVDARSEWGKGTQMIVKLPYEARSCQIYKEG
ncbi:MAG: ATP-binding protein [Cellulosilyticaceae bacterium]